MNVDHVYLYYLWQKLTFQIIHKSAIWVLFVLISTAIATWHLATLLDKHNARKKDAKFARKIAIGYMISALALWLLSFTR